MSQSWIEATSSDGRKVRLHPDGTWDAQEDPRPAESSTPPDFRRALWGMSLEQVVATEEGTPADRADDHLIYDGTVGHFPCWINYQFVANQLATTWYSFRQDHSQQSNFILDYDSLREMLDKKYGPGNNSGPLWTNNLYADEPVSEWGTAIAAGHLFYLCDWSTPRTKVQLHLGGENYTIFFSLRYESVDLAGLKKSTDEANVLKDL